MTITDTYFGADNRASALDVSFSTIRKDPELVIFLHGYKGFKDWGPWNLVAQTFTNRGLDFLKFNFSHNGGTVENPIDFPDLEAFSKNTYSKELLDVECIMEYVSQGLQFNGESVRYKKIHLIGHSRGGGIAILAAAKDSRISTLITWAAVSDFADRFGFDLSRWKEKGVAYAKNGRTGQDMPHLFEFYEDFARNKERLDIPSAAKNIKQPWLIAHGENDESVCFSNADYLKSLNKYAELLMIKKTGHTFGGRHPWDELHLPEKLGDLVEKTIRFIGH